MKADLGQSVLIDSKVLSFMNTNDGVIIDEIRLLCYYKKMYHRNMDAVGHFFFKTIPSVIPGLLRI